MASASVGERQDTLAADAAAARQSPHAGSRLVGSAWRIDRPGGGSGRGRGSRRTASRFTCSRQCSSPPPSRTLISAPAVRRRTAGCARGVGQVNINAGGGVRGSAWTVDQVELHTGVVAGGPILGLRPDESTDWLPAGSLPGHAAGLPVGTEGCIRIRRERDIGDAPLSAAFRPAVGRAHHARQGCEAIAGSRHRRAPGLTPTRYSRWRRLIPDQLRGIAGEIVLRVGSTSAGRRGGVSNPGAGHCRLAFALPPCRLAALPPWLATSSAATADNEPVRGCAGVRCRRDQAPASSPCVDVAEGCGGPA